MLSNLAQDVEDLDGEFAGRRQDEGTETGIGTDVLEAVEVLENWDEEGEGLAAAGLCCAEDVAALESEWDGFGLDVGHHSEVTCLQACLGGLREGEICEVFVGGRLGFLCLVSHCLHVVATSKSCRTSAVTAASSFSTSTSSRFLFAAEACFLTLVGRVRPVIPAPPIVFQFSLLPDVSLRR